VLTFGSFFAGMGGFDLGFEQSGMSSAWQVEIDPSANKVLSVRWPGVLRRKDIRDCGSENLPKVDVVCGGFPCQDLSVAGKRAGLMDGARSGLYWEMLRVINELKPSIVVWENVAGLSSSDCGRDFARVLFSLRDCGYFGCGRLVDAQYFGLAQRRRRWFGVFARGHSGTGCGSEILSLREGLRGHPAPSRKAGERVAGTLEARTSAGGFPGTDGACDGHIVEVVGALCADSHPGSYSGQDAYSGRIIAMQERMESENLTSGPGGKGWSDDGIAFTLEARHKTQCGRMDSDEKPRVLDRENQNDRFYCHRRISMSESIPWWAWMIQRLGWQIKQDIVIQESDGENDWEVVTCLIRDLAEASMLLGIYRKEYPNIKFRIAKCVWAFREQSQ